MHFQHEALPSPYVFDGNGPLTVSRQVNFCTCYPYSGTIEAQSLIEKAEPFIEC